MRFDSVIIQSVVAKLLQGDDYREEVINAINLEFLDFALDFFKAILEAKMQDCALNLEWYKNAFYK